MALLKDKFINGAAIGLVIPLIIGGLLHLFNTLMVENATINSAWIGFKPSTIMLMAICGNLIPTAIANKRRWDDFIRGLLVVTMIYCLVWFFLYGMKSLSWG